MAKQKRVSGGDAMVLGVKATLDGVFRDITVSPATTRSRLTDVIEHCQTLIESLDLDPDDDDGGLK